MTSSVRRLNAFFIGAGLLALPVYTTISLTDNAWQLDGTYWVMAWFDDPGGAFRVFVPLALLAIADLNAVILGVRVVLRLLRPSHGPDPARSELSVTGATLLLGALDLRWLYSLSLIKLALPLAAVTSVWLAWRHREAPA